MSPSRRRYLRTAAVAMVPLGAGCQALLPGGGADDQQNDDGSGNGSFSRGATSTDPDELKARARSFVESLDAGEYETANSQFASHVQDIIGPDNLEDIWNRLVDEHGQYQDMTEVRHETDAEREIIYVTVGFESGQQVFQFNFVDGNLTGLSLPEDE